MTNCMADLSFRLYLKKESCLYDINIKRTFSDHNLSDANSLVALPHSETSCRLLFIHVSITDLDVTRTTCIPKYGEKKKGLS